MASEAAEQIHSRLLSGDNSGARDMLIREYINGDFNRVVDDLETLTKASPAPDLYSQRTKSGSITKVQIDDSLFFDTTLFDLYGYQDRIELEVLRKNGNR